MHLLMLESRNSPSNGALPFQTSLCPATPDWYMRLLTPSLREALLLFLALTACAPRLVEFPRVKWALRWETVSLL